MPQGDSLVESFKITEKRISQMWTTIDEHGLGPQWLTADPTRSNSEATVSWPASQLQVVYQCKSLLRKELSKLKADKSYLEDQGDLEALHKGRTPDLLDSASETNRKFPENIRNLRAHYDREFADLCFDRNSLQAWLVTCDGCSPVSYFVLHVIAWRRVEGHMHRRTCVWSQIYPMDLVHF